MSTKKVLFTSHTANFSKFNRPFMRWLKEQGFEVHYASAGEEEVLDCDTHFTVPFSRNPLKVSNIKAYHQLKKILAQNKYDIIHTHTPVGSVITRLAARATRKNGTHVIYTAHGFHFFKGAPLLNWLTYYPVEKVMSKYTDTLVTINKEDYEIAKNKFYTNVHYVAGVGIDPKKFDFTMTKAEKIKLRKSLGLKESDFVMIYPAELNKNKNQLLLIKSLAHLVKDHTDIHLLLPGGDSLNGYYQQHVDEMGLAKNVHFLGYRSDIPQLLKIADLSVSSSKREGLPVNIMEAMYVGMPIIATDCRGNRDLVRNNFNGFLIAQNDIQAVVNSIEKLYRDSILRMKFAQNGKKIIEDYLLSKIIIKISRVYIGFQSRKELDQ